MGINDQNGEITVELARPGIPFDSVLLELPQEWAGIRDALEVIRCTHPQSIFTTSLESRKEGYLELSIKEPVGLYQLNRLASRLSQLDEADCMKVDGLAMLAMKRKGVTELSAEEYIDLTYNLENVHLVDAATPKALGRFLYENDLLPELWVGYNVIVQKYIDFEIFGQERIERGEAAFLYGICVVFEDEIVRLTDPADYLYIPEKPAYAIKLACMPKDAPDAEQVVLTLPAGAEEIPSEGRELVSSRFSDFSITIADSTVPQLIGWQDGGDCLAEYEELSAAIAGMSAMESVKFKAMLEATHCATVSDTCALTRFMEEFELISDVSSCEDYGAHYLQRYLPPEHAEVLMRDHGLLYRLGQAALDFTNTALTPYGALRSADGFPLPDFTLFNGTIESEQQGMGR